MAIGKLDQIETTKLRKREERKTKALRVESDKLKSSDVREAAVYVVIDDSSDASNSTTISDEVMAAAQPSTSKSEIQTQMRLHLPTLARVSDQYAVSDRCAAAIATATLHDIGIVTKDDCSQVIDRSKVHRERKKTRFSIKKADLKASETVLESIFFDGRKDKTLYQEKIGDRFHRRTISEEHISLIEEPNSLYLGHITPSSGSGKHIAENILKYLNENNINVNNLKAIGCDGTAVNTGSKNGAIRFFETLLNHPLQWLICQLHANELPLRHLFAHLDGDTTGPRAFSGPIGKSLEDCEKLPVTEFEKLTCYLPEMTSDDLSTDQNYLYEMCQAISCGQCSLNLASHNPGKMSHSRWLTTANRVLRLFIGSKNPSQNLKILVEYVIKVYAPMWFQIKTKSSCISGAQNIFTTIQLSRYLSSEIKQIVNPVIQRNAYFCHPENLLLGMITDKRIHIRELAFRQILKAREMHPTPTPSQIRQFRIPTLNFNATDYIDVINWQDCDVTSPPILANFSTEELKFFINSPEVPNFEVQRFPCHTQAVERCVKLVTEASLSVIGNEARDGFIRAKIKSRSIMPCFETKGQYKW